MYRTERKVSLRVGSCCSICGGIFDEEGICNIGKHTEGRKYYVPVKKKKKQKVS